MKNIISKIGNQRGAAVLITVLVTMIVILIIGLSLALNSIAESEILLYQSKAARVFDNIDGCSEESLLRLKRKPSYAGETLTIDETSCNITVSGSGNTRTILITATNTNYTKILQLNVTISPSFAVTGRQEITN